MLAGENGGDASWEAKAEGTAGHPLPEGPYGDSGICPSRSDKAEDPGSGSQFILCGDCGWKPGSKFSPVRGPESGSSGAGGTGLYVRGSNPPRKIERFGGSPLLG